MCQGEIGPHFQGGAELGHGFGKPAQCVQCKAEVVGRRGALRLQSQGGPAAVHGLLVLAEGTVSLGQVGVVSGGFGLHSQSAADQLDGPGRIAVLVVQDAKEMQGAGVVGLPGEHGVIATSRVGETTRLEQLPTGDQVCIHHANPLRGKRGSIPCVYHPAEPLPCGSCGANGWRAAVSSKGRFHLPDMGATPWCHHQWWTMLGRFLPDGAPAKGALDSPLSVPESSARTAAVSV